MLLSSAVTTETNCVLPSKEFSIKASPVAFDILSSKLYSDPILAIVRELLTNAYDSHKAADNLETPIHLHIPDYMNRSLIIRDYGIGLSKEEVLTLYTTFFDSTKSTSNEFTGCFGLGSKTPFSYTSSFTINSYYNGTKYSFIATKKNGYPNIILVNEVPTDEHNGLEVTIPVENDYDTSTFRDTIKKYLARIPEIQVDAEVEREIPDIAVENVKCYNNDKWYGPNTARITGVSIKQGQNIYDIDNAIANSELELKKFPCLCMVSSKFDIEIEVPIGTFGITPSREQISIDKDNAPKLLELLIAADKVVSEYMDTKWDSQQDKTLSKYLSDLKDILIRNKYFDDKDRVSATFRHYTSNSSAHAILKANDIKMDAINRYSISRYNNPSFEADKKNLVILIPFEFKYPSFRKLCYTLQNYPELDDINILLAHMPKKVAKVRTVVRSLVTEEVIEHETYYDNVRYLRYVRAFYGVIWLLNNMPEYNFDIDIISLSRFMREHPNHTKPKEERAKVTTHTKVDEDTIFIRTRKMKFHEHSNIYTLSSNSPNEDSLKAIKAANENTNTLVVLNDDFAKSDGWNKEDMCELTFRVLSQIKNVNGDNILMKYVSQKLRRYNVGVTPQPLYMSNLNILRIGKTCKKYFKGDYAIVTIDEVLEFFRNEQFRITEKTGLWEDNSIQNLMTLIDNSFDGKLKNLITNTTMYRKAKLLLAIHDRYNTFNRGTWNSTVNYDRVETLIKRVFDDPSKCLLDCKVCPNIVEEFKRLTSRLDRYRRYVSYRAAGRTILENKGKQILINYLFGKEESDVLF